MLLDKPSYNLNPNSNTNINTDYRADNIKTLTADEVKAKIVEVQTQNIQAIQDGIGQIVGENSSGRADNVKIKVPADANGRPIQNPTTHDWENAAKNNRFVEVEDSPARLAANYYGLKLVDFGNADDNKVANRALLQELRDALSQGVIFPSNRPIPTSPAGDAVRAWQARQTAFYQIINGIGNPNAGNSHPPSYAFPIKVPADAKGNPIKNPSTQDWIDAQKSNRWAEVRGTSDQLAADYFGVKVELGGNWRTAYKDNNAALDQASKEGSRTFNGKTKIANGDFSAAALLDIPNSGQVIQEVFKVLGPAYNSELSKANDLREQMDSLRKKNDALQKLENSISSNDTSGRNFVDFDVPTRRYVYDSEGNKVLDSDGKPKTEAITHPASEEDWARAAEWKSIKELEGKEINGRDAAKNYLRIQLSHIDGDNAHNTNLSNNIQKIGNARTAVQSEMSKLSGQFDFRMGNSQTNLQNANKIIGNINEIMLGIARAI